MRSVDLDAIDARPFEEASGLSEPLEQSLDLLVAQGPRRRKQEPMKQPADETSLVASVRSEPDRGRADGWLVTAVESGEGPTEEGRLSAWMG